MNGRKMRFWITPFWRLREEEEERIRETMRILVARIRSRAALRQKHARKGQPDPRRTLRSNMRYGGVPFQLVQRRRQLRPSLVLLCDVSTSVRHCAEFLLTMIYELQDQVRRTRSYVYIYDLHDISETLHAATAREALQRVLAEDRPGYYSTDWWEWITPFSARTHALAGFADHGDLPRRWPQ